MPPLVRVDGVLVAVDQGYPSDLWRFELDADEPGRVVNPPIPTFFTGLARADDAVLSVGLDCSGVELPGPDDEPSCPGGVVVQRYDPGSDTWQVLNDAAATPGVFALHAVDSGVGTIIAQLRTPEGSQFVEVGGDGAISELSMPEAWGPFDGDPDTSTKLCPSQGGALLYRGSSSDVNERGSAAAIYSSTSETWSDPRALGPELSDGLGGTTVCTGNGIAVFGYPKAGEEVGPWVVFADGAWARSRAPSFPRSSVSIPTVGVFFDGVLWSVDADGGFDRGDLVVESILTGVDLGDGRLAALVAPEGDEPRLQIRRIP